MRADNTAAIVHAAHRRHDDALQRATEALRRLDHSGQPITFHSVARTAQVSRGWLYRQPALRAEIDRLRTAQRHSKPSLLPAAQLASVESLRGRLEATREEIHRLREENERLLHQNAELLGQWRLDPRRRQQ